MGFAKCVCKSNTVDCGNIFSIHLAFGKPYSEGNVWLDKKTKSEERRNHLKRISMWYNVRSARYIETIKPSLQLQCSSILRSYTFLYKFPNFF